MNPYYAMVVTEEGIAHLVQFDEYNVEEFEERIAEHFGSGCQWNALTENRIRLGWQ